MPQLLVRDIEKEVVRELKKRAGEHGVSTEEEHRRILRESLLPKKMKPGMTLYEYIMKTEPIEGYDEVFERQKDYGRDIEL